MRNLKRALSLTLASVMLLGMMVVGSSAAGYPDIDAEDNVEAIEVLQAVQVMRGDENGNFRPDDSVSRAEMAVVMALLLDLDYQYYEATCPFNDVPAWARSYVGACYANGIVSGYNATTYGANDPVNAVQAASMLMRALGYFKYDVDYKDGFETATVRQASKIRLFDGVNANSRDNLTRNQVAQLALNALKTPIVEPEDNTINITSSTGNSTITATGGQVNYVVTASSQAYARAIDDAETSGTGLNKVTGYIVELGEKLYNGELKLDEDAIDDFGRPSRQWEYDGSTVGTYAKKEQLRAESYTDEVKGSDLYNLLGNSIVTDPKYTLTVYVDGSVYTAPSGNAYTNFTKANFTRNNAATMDGTGRGVLTEIYLDTESHEITAAIINTYLAKATADYNTRTEKLTVSVYESINSTGSNVTVTKTLDLKDFPQIETVKKDDFLLVNWADLNASASSKKVVAASSPEILTNVAVSKFSGNGTKVTKLTTGGTEYKAAAKLVYDAGTLADYNKTLLTNKTYNVYLDQFGNAIGAEVYSGTDNYVFITGVKLNSSTIADANADANAIFLDGTMKTIKVNVKDTNTQIRDYNSSATFDYREWNSTNMGTAALKADHNTWYLYTLDESNSVYTLEPVAKNHQFTTTFAAAATNNTVNSKNIRVNGVNDRKVAPASPLTGLYGFGNEKSVFITVDDAGIVDGSINAINEVTGCFTNVQTVDITAENLASRPSIFTVTNDKDYIVGSVIIGENAGSNANYAYIFTGANSEEKIGDTYYWEFTAAIDGEVKDLTVKTKFPAVITTIQNILNSTTNQANKAYAHGYLFRLSFDADGYVTNATPFHSITSGTIVNGTGTGATNVTTTGTWATSLDGKVVRYMNYTESNGNVLQLIGNSLYNGTTSPNYKGVDVGLPLHPDCKFIVAQTEYTKLVKEPYADIDSALGALADYWNDSDGILHFKGTIAAVLDTSGRATLVVFDSKGGINPDQNQNQNPLPGAPNVTPMPYNTTISYVNTELAAGRDVYIYGTWQPSDLSATNKSVYLRGGTELYIEGDFDATQTPGITVGGVGSTSKLTVTGKFTTNSTSTSNINFQLVTGALEVKATGNVTINEVSRITGIVGADLTVASGATLTVNKNMTVSDGTTDGSATVSGTGTTTVNAHVDFYGTWSGAPLNVTQFNTMNATGGFNNVTIILGDGNSAANNGRIVGALGSSVTIRNKNVSTGGSIAPLVIDVLPAGSVLIVDSEPGDPAVQVGIVEAGATIVMMKGTLTVTGEMNTDNIIIDGKATPETKIVLEANTEVGSTKIQTPEGNTLNGVTLGAAVTIEPTTTVVTSADAKTNLNAAVTEINKVEQSTASSGSANADTITVGTDVTNATPGNATTTEVPSAVEAKAPVVIKQIVFIQDQASWMTLPEATRKAWIGGTNDGSWATLNASASKNLPWCAIEVAKNDASETDLALKAMVTVPGGTDAVNVTNTKWKLAGTVKEGETKWYSFEMGKANAGQDGNPSGTTAAEGAYKVELYWAPFADTVADGDWSTAKETISGTYAKSYAATNLGGLDLSGITAPVDSKEATKTGDTVLPGNQEFTAAKTDGGFTLTVTKSATTGGKTSIGDEVYQGATLTSMYGESTSSIKGAIYVDMCAPAGADGYQQSFDGTTWSNVGHIEGTETSMSPIHILLPLSTTRKEATWYFQFKDGENVIGKYGVTVNWSQLGDYPVATVSEID